MNDQYVADLGDYINCNFENMGKDNNAIPDNQKRYNEG